MLNSANKQNKTVYYAMLFLVIVLWGIDPIVNKMLYYNYSPVALSILNTLFACILFFTLSINKLKLINKKFLKVAVPIGALNSLGCLLQRIGLLMTTPVNYAFLEHLSCAFVPIALYFITKKRPSLMQFLIITICLIGCMLISGILGGNISFNVGDILCAVAGVTFGFSIALMSVHLKSIDITLYTLFQFISYFILSVLLAILLNCVKIDGVPLEKFRFSLSLNDLLFAIGFGLITVSFGWLMRNTAISHLNPIFVAVTTPLSAIISTIVSIICGTDKFSLHLLIGAMLVVFAVILSGLKNSTRKRS